MRGPQNRLLLAGPAAQGQASRTLCRQDAAVDETLAGGHDVVLEQAQDLCIGVQDGLEQFFPGVSLHTDAKIGAHGVPFLGLVATGALPFEDLLSPLRVGGQIESVLVVLHHTVPFVRGVGLKQIQSPVSNRFVRMLRQQDPVVLLQRRPLHLPPLHGIQQPGRSSAVGDQCVKGGSPLPGREGAPPGEDQTGDLQVVVSSHDLEGLGTKGGIGNGIQKVSEYGTRVPKSDSCQGVDRLQPVLKREVGVQGLPARLRRQPRHPEVPGHTGRRHSDPFRITFQEFTGKCPGRLPDPGRRPSPFPSLEPVRRVRLPAKPPSPNRETGKAIPGRA